MEIIFTKSEKRLYVGHDNEDYEKAAQIRDLLNNGKNNHMGVMEWLNNLLINYGFKDVGGSHRNYVSEDYLTVVKFSNSLKEKVEVNYMYVIEGIDHNLKNEPPILYRGHLPKNEEVFYVLFRDLLYILPRPGEPIN